MEYTNVTEGIFLGKTNRFTASVKVNEEVENAHLKNTGHCGELLGEGAKVFLEESSKTQRKTKYDLFAVLNDKEEIVNIDTFAQTQILHDFLANENDIFPPLEYLQDECEYEEATFDYYFNDGSSKIIMNVCGCYNEHYGIGTFPCCEDDKEVQRVKEITRAYQEGYDAYIGFFIHINSIDYVIPNRSISSAYADALRDAVKAGVKLLFFRCDVTKNYIRLRDTHIIDAL